MLNTCLPWLIPVENGEYLLIMVYIPVENDC